MLTCTMKCSRILHRMLTCLISNADLLDVFRGGWTAVVTLKHLRSMMNIRMLTCTRKCWRTLHRMLTCSISNADLLDRRTNADLHDRMLTCLISEFSNANVVSNECWHASYRMLTCMLDMKNADLFDIECWPTWCFPRRVNGGGNVEAHVVWLVCECWPAPWNAHVFYIELHYGLCLPGNFLECGPPA